MGTINGILMGVYAVVAVTNPATDQCLCFHFLDRTIPLLPKLDVSSF